MPGRIRRHEPAVADAANGETFVVEVEPEQLSGMFAAPGWLRDLGVMSWLLVGVAALLVGTVWLLSLLSTIVTPVVTASILAAVLSPLVAILARRLPRGGSAALVFVALLVIGIAVAVGVLAAIVSQTKGLQGDLQGAVDKLQGYLNDLGVSAEKAQSAGDDASSTVSSAFHALLQGAAKGVTGLASLAVFLTFTALSLFFLLKDGPSIRGWIERHMGIPGPVAHTITQRTIESLRGYFAGVTAVAAFNAILIGLGALVLGVPHVGAIALINFIAAYIPYLGAWSAGAFTVLLTLSTQGSSAAVAMIVITLLANGALQQMIQPIAFGATLGIHPLAVLIVTISGGALFGTIGLILAAPVTSAAVHISSDLARARARGGRGRGRGGRGAYRSSTASVNTARAVAPGATTRSPSWLRSASTGAVIGSKQMTGWSGGAKSCA
jgi:predicted PurR-regulated permease PerM